MKVSLKEYAEIHGLKHSTVRNYVRRGLLTVIDKDTRYTYVDSDAEPKFIHNNYTTIFGKQPRLSGILRSMKARCYNEKNTHYSVYGGRGITICDEWLKDTGSFIEWALSHGYKDGLTIDRIDNDGNYCPENCQWLTKSENSKKSQAERRLRRPPKEKIVKEKRTPKKERIRNRREMASDYFDACGKDFMKLYEKYPDVVEEIMESVVHRYDAFFKKRM